MPTVVSVVNNKPDTTYYRTQAAVLIASLAHGIAERGKRVLVLDMDPEATTSTHLRPDTDEVPCMANALLSEIPLSEAIRPSRYEGIDVVTANAALHRAHRELHALARPVLHMRDMLAQSEVAYDFVLIDCPNTLSMTTANALAASDGLFFAFAPTANVLDSMEKLLDRVRMFQIKMGHFSPLLGATLFPDLHDDALNRILGNHAHKFFGGKWIEGAWHDTDSEIDGLLNAAERHRLADYLIERHARYDAVKRRSERPAAVFSKSTPAPGVTAAA